MGKKTTAIILVCLIFTLFACNKAPSDDNPGSAIPENVHAMEENGTPKLPHTDIGNTNTPNLPDITFEETQLSYPERTLSWNGFELTLENYYGRSEEVKVPVNVLIRGDKTLTMLFSNSSGSDAAEYGITEIVQVKIDGAWYSIPINLSQRESPVILEPFVIDPQNYIEPYSDEARTEYTVDFSILGELPPGQYRFVERFFVERLQYEYNTLSYFWVIEPGGDRPPESETSGLVRLDDIVFRVESIYELRGAITDKDISVSILTENLSGKDYIATEAMLEMIQNGQWTNVCKTNSNLGLLQGWQSRSNRFYLDEPLEVGRYRIRLSMSVFNATSSIEPVYDFTVIPFDSVPEPVWEISRLRLSRYDATRQSDGVRVVLANSVLNKRNTVLEFTVISDLYYSFGEYYMVEVFLDGAWYGIPFVNGNFIGIGYSTYPGASLSYSCYPVFSYGILPAGQYRLIKEFDLIDPYADRDMLPIYLAKEYAIAEFTVEETLDSLKLN